MPLILIFVATFNDTTHLDTGLLSKPHLHFEKRRRTAISSVFQIGQNPTKNSDTLALSLLTGKAAEEDKWGYGYPFYMLSSEEKTVSLCDINAHVTAMGEPTTINIEILSDTSKLLRNEPLYL